MKTKNGISRKMRYGSLSVGLSAAVIVAVLVLNILASVLCSNAMIFTDMTTEPLYTLSGDTEFLLDKTFEELSAAEGDREPAKVDIIFCADPDLLTGNSMLRPVYYTALQLQKSFPDRIHVETRDVWDNPSSVDEYLVNAYTRIYPGNVIVASGTEFRIYNDKAFYVYGTDNPNVPLAVNTEQTFVKGILAVTRAEAPICALTVNHGEPFATEEGRAKYSEFLKVIEAAGYDVVFLNLETDEIPENCRLIVTFDPQTDYVSNYKTDGFSEAGKLDEYLGKAYSYMVFADADTPKLPNMEEYLEEWGITFNRYEKNAAYQVIDSASALAPDGYSIIAQYETEGVGGAITQDMREYNNPPMVIFGNALSISYSPSYEQTYVLADESQETGAFIYGAYERNMIQRNIYDLFRTTNTAYARVQQDGNDVLDGEGNPIRLTDGSFRLMTLTEHVRRVSEGVGYTNANNFSYVCAVGSTSFVSNDFLTSDVYGNADVLLSLFRTIGREVVPVGLDFKVLYEDSIDSKYLSSTSATWYTVIFTALPAVVVSCIGSVVLVKRKFRK